MANSRSTFLQGLSLHPSELNYQSLSLAYQDSIIPPDNPSLIELFFKGLSTHYSYSHLYSQWLNIPFYLLPFTIPHGFDIWDDIHPTDSLPGKPALLWGYPRIEKYLLPYTTIFRYPFIITPPPFLILRDIYSRNGRDLPFECTYTDSCLFFLCHSTDHLQSESTYDEISSIVSALRYKHKTVNCVLYFRDLHQRHLYEPLFDNFFCCGHSLDPFFLLRLHALISSHSSVSYNKIGTPAFHAASVCKPTYHYDSSIKINISPSSLKTLTAAKRLNEANILDGKYYTEFLSNLHGFLGQDISAILRTTISSTNCLSASHSLLIKLSRNPFFISKVLFFQLFHFLFSIYKFIESRSLFARK